jgi:hypothetical protein
LRFHVLRRFSFCAFLALVVVAGTANARPHSRRPAVRCSTGLLSQLRTLSDRDRRKVYLKPVTTTIETIAAKAPPAKQPTRRQVGFPRQVWRLVAQITLYRLAPNGELQLVLFDSGSYMQAAVPAAACIPLRARQRAAIIAARAAIMRCGPASESWEPLGAVAYVSGVGYWGKRGARTAAPNGAELSPVVDFAPIAGCGA